MRYAVVDIGSNTIKMNIYDAQLNEADEKSGQIELETVLCESSTLGLMSYSRKKIMSDNGIVRLIATLNNFKKLADNIGTDIFYCYATASLRNIDNTDEVITLVRDHTGIEIDLISGENEALWGFEGLRYGLKSDVRCGVMIDLGGGSTELLGFVDGLAVRAVSVPFGCLTLYKKFVSEIFPSKDELHDIKEFVNKEISDIDWLNSYGDTVYLVGGTGRALGRLHNEMYRTDRPERGYTMDTDEVFEVISHYRRPSKDDAETLIRLVPDRLHTIIPGIMAYKRIISKIGADKVVISMGGLREGYLLNRINADRIKKFDVGNQVTEQSETDNAED